MEYIKKCYENLKQKRDGQEESYRLSTQESEGKKKKTLVLDLDETLVHCEFKENQNFNYETILDVWHRGILYNVYLCRRPHLREFLKQMSLYYEIIIFTAGYESYCDKVLKYIDIDKHISDYFARSNCIFVNGNCLKDLTILDRPLDQLIFIDNNPNAFELQPENGLLIPSFFDSDEDDCLVRLIPFLKFLASKSCIKPINKYLQEYEFINGSLFSDPEITLQCHIDGEEESLNEESCIIIDNAPKHRKTQTLMNHQQKKSKVQEARSQSLFSG